MAGGNQVAVEFVIEIDLPSAGGHDRDEEIHFWTFNDARQAVWLCRYTGHCETYCRGQGLRQLTTPLLFATQPITGHLSPAIPIVYARNMNTV